MHQGNAFVFLIHIFTLLILDCKNSEWRKSYLYVSGSCSWLWFVHLLDGAWLLGGCADCECFLLDSLATTLSEGCDWTAALSDRHERENQLLYLHSCSSGTGKGGSPKKKRKSWSWTLFIYLSYTFRPTQTLILRADSLCAWDLESFLMISTPVTGAELPVGAGRLHTPSNSIVCSLTVPKKAHEQHKTDKPPKITLNLLKC